MTMTTHTRSLLLATLLAGLVPTLAQPADGNPVPGAATAVVATNAVVQPKHVTLGLDRVAVLQIDLFGEPLWKYLAAIAYLALAVVSAKLIDWLLNARLRALAARSKTRLYDILIDLVRGPVRVVVFVIVLHIGLDLFAFAPWLSHYISIALRVVVAWSLTYVVLRLTDIFLQVWRERAVAAEDKLFDNHLFPIIRKAVKAFVVVTAALLTTQNLGVNITSLLAGLSVGGLALGLAAQDTIANLFGAVAIFLDTPFRVGDRIQIESHDGVVEEIGVRSTRLRNLDGHLVSIPNKTMGNASIVNISKRPNIKTVMNIGVTYDTSTEQVKQASAILNEVFRSHAMTADVWISFNQFADSSLNFLIIHWWNSTDYKAYLAGMQEMNLELKRRFDAAGIAFAFPTRTLYVKQDSDWRIHDAAPAGPAAGVVGAPA